MKPRSLALALGTALWGVALTGLAGPPAGDKPNVLFLMADDLRPELGCYGAGHVISPNIDRLAKRGRMFEHAYCQQALCNPSRASMLTGLRPDSLGIWNLPTHLRQRRPGIVTLPQHFRNNGYFTECVGKIFHNWRQDIHGDPQSWSVPQFMHYARHDDDKPRVEGKPPGNEIKLPRSTIRDVPDEAYFDGRIATRAIESLRGLKKNRKPFFLAVGFWKPHLPFNAPKRYWNLYDPAKVKLPESLAKPANGPDIALHDSRELLRAFGGRKPSPRDIRELRRGYYAATTYMDAQVGRVLDELDRLGLRDSTIVVFTADHGFHLGEHSLWCKTSNYEWDAAVPLIIAPPRLGKRGAASPSPVELLDLYPTLAELCGLAKPTHLEGASLVPALKDPLAEVKPFAITQHPRPAYYTGKEPEVMGYSLRTRHHRYTEWRKWRTGEVVARELYDHQNDPGENKNVAAESARRVQVLSRKLAKVHPVKRHPADD